MNTFYPLTVTAVRRETRDAVVVTLQPAAADRDRFRFNQGQYLTMRRIFDGEEIRRSYSICAAVQDGELRVGIKKISGGLFSTWANEQLQPGVALEALVPMGSFYVALDPDSRRHYAGFAAGSGITPLLSILKTTLLAESHSSFTLFYGNRASGSVMFREELEDLKNRFLGRLNLVHILTREQQDIELFNGRIGRAKCEQLFRYWLDVATLDQAFICGPQQMMLAVADALQAHGMDRQRIKFELFASDLTTRRPRVQQKVTTAAENHCAATLIVDGRARSLQLAKHSVTILDGALQQGLELPYACKAGVCSTCRAILKQGEVDMDVNFALEDYEVARGYILTCQSYPVTDTIVVDFDH
jgi:ring-1,2-phenylacetyl-CoA epoxidase subunit PaaE